MLNAFLRQNILITPPPPPPSLLLPPPPWALAPAIVNYSLLCIMNMTNFEVKLSAPLYSTIQHPPYPCPPPPLVSVCLNDNRVFFYRIFGVRGCSRDGSWVQMFFLIIFHMVKLENHVYTDSNVLKKNYFHPPPEPSPPPLNSETSRPLFLHTI